MGKKSTNQRRKHQPKEVRTEQRKKADRRKADKAWIAEIGALLSQGARSSVAAATTGANSSSSVAFSLVRPGPTLVVNPAL